MLITKALAEIKLSASKIEKNLEEALRYSWRRGDQIDPLAQQGGSAAFVTARIKSIEDLFNNIVSLRRSIRRSNENTMLRIDDVNMSVADWLTWRRDVAERHKEILEQLLRAVDQNRRAAAPRQPQPGAPEPIISNVNEKKLMEELEQIKNALGVLDGELSVLNATTEIAA